MMSAGKCINRIGVADTEGKSMANETKEGENISFLDLPVEVLSYIFDFLSFEQLSMSRSVCRTFDTIAQSKLNVAFDRLNSELESAMLVLKHMLPKRESKRRYHPLARINEIYSALETRFALLNMTFKKYIEDGVCCFMAGKILDEAFCVLHYVDECVKKGQQPKDTQDLLKDIRDYSSMAIEYFDDNIAPNLQAGDPLSLYSRARSCFSSMSFSTPTPFTAIAASSSPDTPSTSRTAFSPFNIIELAKINEWRKSVEEKVKAQEKIIAEQGRLIKEQGVAVNHIIRCLQKVSPELSATYLNFLTPVDSTDSSGMSSTGLGSLKRKFPSGEETEAKKGRTM